MTTALHTSRRGQPRDRTPRFQLDWQNRHSNRFFRQSSIRTVAHQIPRQIRSLFDWIYQRRDRDPEDLGSRFRDLAYMRLDLPEPEEWWAVQALGRGGFGAVMMFQKYNNDTGDVVDEIVVKTARAQPSLAAALGDIGVSKEAAVMAQLNNTDLDGFVVLRDFKTIFPNPHVAGVSAPGHDGADPDTDSDGDADADIEGNSRRRRLLYTWRYYLELCEHGDLERLRVKYKAYGRYLPEPFLWHLFFWLAQSLERYAEGIDQNGDAEPSFRNTSDEDWGLQMDHAYLLHNDIKPMNIFLGDIDGPHPWAYYPIPRIGDMGLADITEGRDAKNRAFNMRKGTAAWMAPEQRFNEMDLDTPFYPFGDAPDDTVGPHRYRKGAHYITSAANVAAIGMVMFQMMTLREHDFLHDRIGQLLNEAIDPGTNHAARNVCILRVADLRTSFDIDAWGQGYSNDLRRMIMRCLMLNPQDRITEQDLKTQSLAHYQRAVLNLPGGDDAQANVDNSARVYFARNDIHTGAMNPGEIRYSFPEWRSMRWWKSTFWKDLMWQQEEWGWDRPYDMPNIIDVGIPRWPQALVLHMINTHPMSTLMDPSSGSITPTPPAPTAPPASPAPPAAVSDTQASAVIIPNWSSIVRGVPRLQPGGRDHHPQPPAQGRTLADGMGSVNLAGINQNFYDGLTPNRGPDLSPIPEDNLVPEDQRGGHAHRGDGNNDGRTTGTGPPARTPGPVRTTQLSSRFDPLGGRGSRRGRWRPSRG